MRQINRESILIGIILLLALAIRVWGINFGLPYLYHPDEFNKILIAQNIFKTGDLNPHYFNKPTLFIYLNALLYMPYYLLGKVFGVFHNPNDILSPIRLVMGVAQAPMPTTVIMGRLLTVLFATASIFFIFLLGKQFSHKTSVGVLAAVMIAISPDHVLHSRYITENSFLIFFIIIAVWASVRIYQQGKTKDYVIAGIAAGLAASSKYPGFGIAIVPLCAHFLRLHLKKGLKDYRFLLSFCLIPIAFFATTPFALLDHKKFLQDTLYEVNHYSTGHPGMEGNSLIWYLNYAWQTAGLIYIIAILEILRGIYWRSKDIILLSVFPLAYFAVISGIVVRNDRTFLPVTPMLFVLAASFIVYIFNQAQRIESDVFKKSAVVVVILLSVISFVLPIVKTIGDTIHLTTTDSRETSRIWINQNLPSGAKMAIESYAPFIDPARFSITAFGSMIEHEPEWYIEHGFDYAVFSQRMYGRFYREPAKYNKEVSKYDNLFGRFYLVRLFTDGGSEVRVYKVNAAGAAPRCD